jgi:Asp-tRNA(Asn)/Glu-tRNA(Gln) amidotransferase A subunit family amidase
MPEGNPRSDGPQYWPIAALTAAYARRELTPREVLEQSLARLAAFNPTLHAFIGALDGLAHEQAAAAEAAYRRGTAGPLAGVPISIKDTFDVAGQVSTRGSLIYRSHVAPSDSGAVRRLRESGAVFVGKTNTAEFGQSATTDNRLGEECRNPWDPSRTPGGSSGGAAASVAAGIATAALGADGGGSIRIPAAFSGLVGIKPTFGLCKDEGGFPAMTDFCCPGPLAWRVADARVMLGVLAGQSFARSAIDRPLRVAWCPNPEGRPVDPELARVVADAVSQLTALGHRVDEFEPPISGWTDIFGPLVLEEEHRQRGHLLNGQRDLLTDYERASLEAARVLDEKAVTSARSLHGIYQARFTEFFETYDVIATPATSVPAFPVGQRPKTIAGRPVDALWGAFPFTAAFNVAGVPGAAIPCGFVGPLPAGLQLICARGQDALLLDLAADLEEALNVDRSAVVARWAKQDREPEVFA